MKILYFGGGLGNQIFEYAFYLSVKDKYPHDKIYGVYNRSSFQEHAGGFELTKVFNVSLPPTSIFAKLIMNIILACNKYIKPTKIYCHNLISPNYEAILFNAHKMNKAFYNNRKEWISFKNIELTGRNKDVIDQMRKKDSVSIHVRRGDFLSSKYAAKHAGVATEEYYSKAIKLVVERFGNPTFFVFSDDIAWCRENLGLQDAIYVDWNKGKDSFIDMYLMSNSKANIIANSTFSYWGAYFNDFTSFVIYPEKWKNSESKGFLDIFPDSWIGL